MKAVVIHAFGKPEVFEINDIRKPQIGENDILIETIGGSVNPVDWKQRKGNHRFLFGSPFPIVLGYDVSGIVIETGKKIQHFKPGDRVCGVLDNKYGGGLAQYAYGSQKCFVHVPSSIDHATSAVLPLAGLTALQALRNKGKIRKGMNVMIIGAAGGVGHYAMQIARIFETRIFAVSSSRHKAFIDRLASNTFLDYTQYDVLRITERFDIIFDAVGKYSFPICMHLLKQGGVYINTLPRPKILVHKLLTIFTRGKKVKTLLMHQNQHDLELLLGWIQKGSLKLCIDKEFTVGQIAQAHKYSESGRTEGKILLRYDW